jgi:hypothetical protein
LRAQPCPPPQSSTLGFVGHAVFIANAPASNESDLQMAHRRLSQGWHESHDVIALQVFCRLATSSRARDVFDVLGAVALCHADHA